MSDLDVSKMKVAELRAELQERGLDVKGVKAVLQGRLRVALEGELADSPAPGVEGEEDVEEQVDEIAEEATESSEQQGEQNTDPEADQEEADEQTAPEDEMPAEVMEEDSQPEHEDAEKDTNEVKQEEPEAMQEEQATQEFIEVKDEVKEEVTEIKDEVTEVKEDEVLEVKDEVDDEVTEVKDEIKEGKDKQSDEKDIKRDSDGRDRERRDDRGRGHKDRKDRSPRRRSPPPVVMEEDDGIAENQCVLSKYISDLNLKVSKDGYSASPFSMDGFAFLWSGVRATHGVTKGKVCYQIKLVEHLNVKHLPEDEKTPHVVRVGWSLDKTSLQLGEEPLSYGYGGTAKFSTNCKFQDYGEKFIEGDVITAYLDFEGEKPVISYAKNDKDLGVAHTIEDDLEGAPLFPHVLVKNTAVDVDLGQKEEPLFPVTEGFTFIGSLPEDDRVRGPVPPPEKKDCEIIMMVGLPGAGKTTWAEKYVQEHPEKKYYILGTNLIMEKMKVMGLRRQRNYAGRFDSLIEKSTKCLNRFFEMAPRKKRNYILDQTNVYPSARRRKMRPFEGYSSKAILLVPTDEEFKKRIEKRTKEEGKDVPDRAVLEMKANFELPVKGELFDEVEFVELPLDEAKTLVEKYRKEGIDKLGPNYKRNNRDRNRGGNRDNRSRNDNRSPRGGNRGGGYQSRGGNRSYGGGSSYGGGYKDNRNRGGSGGYGNRSSGNDNYGGSGYGSSSGGYRQNYGNYGSQGGGYQNRNSGYSPSSGGYGSGYSSQGSSNSGGYGSYSSGGYNYNQYSQPSGQQQQQQYSQQQQYTPQQQQQYQQYYQQQSAQSAYNPYANYYSNYNQSSGYNQGR